MHDPSAPEGLRELQRLFIETVRTPFHFEDGRAAPDPGRYSEELLRGIEGDAKHLAVYNRQYWFRLFSVMQEELPLLGGLLGTYELNRMASAYLSAHPSASYSLNHISDALGEFLAGDHEWNRREIRQAATLDHLHIRAFDAGSWPPLDTARLSADERAGLAERPLSLQPHIGLFEESGNLVESRRRVLQSKDLVEIELRPRRGAWVIHRFQGVVHEKEVSPAALIVLRHLSRGLPLTEALGAAVAEADEAEQAEIAREITSWFEDWSTLGWFVA